MRAPAGGASASATALAAAMNIKQPLHGASTLFALLSLSLLLLRLLLRLRLAAFRDAALSLHLLARLRFRPVLLCLPSACHDGGAGATTLRVWCPAAPSSKPPLLLLHGFGGDAKWTWARNLPRLSRHFHVYAPDLVFFGAQSRSASPLRSVAFQARCAAEAMRLLGVPRYDVAGISYGGFVAYRMAAMFPEAVHRVALVCAGVCLEERDLAEGLFPVAGIGEAAALLVPHRPEEVRRLVRLTFARPPLIMPSCFLWDYIKVMGSDHIQEKAELLYALINGRQLCTLPKLTQPTLIIWGEQDRVFPMELAHRLNRHLEGNSRLVVIKNAGHAVNIEKPREVCRSIIEFFKEPVAGAANADDKV